MRLYYRFMRRACQSLAIIIFRIRVFGVREFPASGGVLIVSNHQSFLDPVLVTLALSREGNFMARDTLFRHPLFRRLIVSLNAFPVRRGTADMTAIKEIIRRLRDGRVVVVFPEATRTEDGSIREFQEGALLVAKRSECWVVPTVIDGAYECWPRSARLPRPGPIRVAYGRPIAPQEVASAEVGELTRRVRSTMLEIQRGLSAKGNR